MSLDTVGWLPRSLLRRLDYVPPWLVIVLGVGSGAVLGAAILAWVSPVVAGVGFVALLGGAVALAYSGEPITVLAKASKQAVGPPVEPEPTSPERIPVTRPEMARIPAGTFRMGSPDDEEERQDHEGPVHEVRISAFECMRVLVTRRLYKELMEEDPGWPEGEADERPVNNVGWNDAIRFCNRLSEQDGRLTPCYQIDDNNDVSWDPTANGYRLLTEAEWEYACRAGTQTRWFFGDDEQELEGYAWFDKNSNGVPQPVGQKDPNAWGLYDMLGNVYEWCWDRYGSYSSERQTDPVGPHDGGSRMLRGGAFDDGSWILRSAFRGRFRPGYRGRFVGFRCARGPRRQP